MALRTRPAQFAATRLAVSQTEHITAASRLVSYLTGFAVQPNKAIVGRQRVRPRVGHPPGRRDQEPADLRDHDPPVGRAGRQPADDRQAVGPARAAGQARASSATSSRARRSTRSTARRSRSPTRRRRSPTPTSSRSSSSARRGPGERRARGLERDLVATAATPTGTVTLRVDGDERTAEAHRQRPVNALFGAVDDALQPVLGWHPTLDRVRDQGGVGRRGRPGPGARPLPPLVGRGPGALVVSGHGLSTNIIEASLEAYLVAINKLHGAEINGVAVAFANRAPARAP